MNEQIEKIFQQVMDEVCDNPLYRFAELVAAAEREACAKLCEERERANLYGVKECATAIRGRTE